MIARDIGEGDPDAPARPSVRPDPEVPERAQARRRYSAAYKARALSEYEGLSQAEKGALLRREGRYSSLISKWHKQRDQAGCCQSSAATSPSRLGSPAWDWCGNERDSTILRDRRVAG